MKKLIIIIMVLITSVANAQIDTIPDSDSQPWYGTRHMVNMAGTDTMAFYQPGDTAHIVANDSIYVHKLLNHDINAGGDTPTLQEVTDAGNTTDNSIGLGTTPISNIHVKKTNPSIRVESESGQIGEFVLQNPDKLWEITNDGTDNNKFKITDVSSASDRLVIESSGNVGIGTTSPSTKLDVNGDVQASGFIRSQASDKRLKTNIKNIDSALDKVSQLRAITFNWNNTAKESCQAFDDERQVGVIAQDIEKVQPEAVSLAPFDNEGGGSKSGENYLTVNEEKLVPLLIQAINEQQKEIDLLKSKLG